MRRLAVLSAAWMVLASVGCVTLKRTPQARFFVLRSLSEPASAPAGGRNDGAVVGISATRLPDHLARPQVVSWSAPGEMRIDEFLRWGEPLDVGITRTVAENLAVLLPNHRVIRHPWPSSAHVRCRVLLDVRVFGLEGGTARLEGRWVLLSEREERPLARRAVSLRRPAAGGDPVLQVQALSELLAELSGQVAAAVEALPADDETPASAAPSGPSR